MDPDPAFSVIDLQDANKKLIFLKKFFFLLLFEDTFTSFFKDKKSKRSHKILSIKVFLLLLLDDRRIRIQEAQKHTDPTFGFGSESATLPCGLREHVRPQHHVQLEHAPHGADHNVTLSDHLHVFEI
jgi:hypothetical protein